MAENVTQLKMHVKAYDNNVLKIKHATETVGKIRENLKKYDAELKMICAEVELSELAGTFNFGITTDLRQIESMLQDQINTNRARVRVATDLSTNGVTDIEREIAAEASLADDTFR